jgi:mono/diheme cytochrome c family protein
MRSCVLVVALCVALGSTACGKDSDPGATVKPAPAATQAPTAADRPQASSTPPPASAAASTVASAPAPSASAASSAVAAVIPAESTKVFNDRCALCHGAHGKGDGPGGAGMKPPPRNWTDPAWQASVTDDHIATALVKGGVAIGESPTMPPSPDLEPKKATVAGLVQIVRSFRKPN